MAEITTKKRKSLPAGQFALPATRQYPIHDAAHVRNAAARLEQNKGSLTAAQYAEAKRNIARAAKKFGVESMYNKPAKKSAEPNALPPRPVRRRGLHMHLAVSPDGTHSYHVTHATDTTVGGVCMRGEGVALAPLPDQTDAIKRLADVEAMLLGEQDQQTRGALAAEAEKLRALADEAAKPVWNQLAKVGVFRGHPAGPFELNPSIFDEIVRNFNATTNKRIPVDFEHASEEDAAKGSIPVEGAPAQGWIVKLENRGEAGLWGLVEWLDLARSYIRDGKYKFFSPAIRFGAKDRVTGQPIGARMTSGALTNNPFLDGLMPLAAKDRTDGDHMNSATHTLDASGHHLMGPHEFFPKLKTILKLHPLASAAECKDHLGKLRSLAERAPHPGAVVDGVSLGDYFHPLKDMMNMAEHEATPEQILDAVEEMIDSALAQHEMLEHPAGPEMEYAEMSAQDLAVQLGAEKAAATSLKTDVARLSVRLKDAEHKLAEANARAEKAEADLQTMRAEFASRAEQELTAKVDNRYATYKDVKKLTDKDREQMLIVAKADPKLFDECYPPVAPNQQHLLRNLAGGRAALTGPTGSTNMSEKRAVDRPNDFGASTMSPAQMVALADKYVREEKMTREDAINRAYREATRAN